MENSTVVQNVIDLMNENTELKKKLQKVETTLEAVMYLGVYKWLNVDNPIEYSPKMEVYADLAADAREIALKAIEEKEMCATFKRKRYKGIHRPKCGCVACRELYIDKLEERLKNG